MHGVELDLDFENVCKARPSLFLFHQNAASLRGVVVFYVPAVPLLLGWLWVDVTGMRWIALFHVTQTLFVFFLYCFFVSVSTTLVACCYCVCGGASVCTLQTIECTTDHVSRQCAGICMGKYNLTLQLCSFLFHSLLIHMWSIGSYFWVVYMCMFEIIVFTNYSTVIVIYLFSCDQLWMNLMIFLSNLECYQAFSSQMYKLRYCFEFQMISGEGGGGSVFVHPASLPPR